MTAQPACKLLPPWVITTLLLITLLGSSPGYALEVSELQLRSSLGAPLAAQLNISHPTPLSLQELIVEQAPNSVYRQMGIETTALNRELIITPVNGGIIHITTRTPVKEPFLSFILRIKWPEGEIYRAFDVLIDPS